MWTFGGGFGSGGGGYDPKAWSRRDMQKFYDNYPSNVDDPRLCDNVKFFTNQIPMRPEGKTIDEVHREWFGKHDFLEYCHSYVQWLFPIQESGLNPEAQVLQKHEIATMKADPAVIRRALKSFQLMLDFYGWSFDTDTYAIARHEKYEGCFENLSWSAHNYLRITRMLKFLSEMGLEAVGERWMEAFQDEIYGTGELARCQRSCEDYWINAFRDSSVTDRLEGRAKRSKAEWARYFAEKGAGSAAAAEASASASAAQQRRQEEDQREGGAKEEAAAARKPTLDDAAQPTEGSGDASAEDGGRKGPGQQQAPEQPNEDEAQ